jgi:RNA polymerase sigma factor (sigma-70 family)
LRNRLCKADNEKEINIDILIIPLLRLIAACVKNNCNDSNVLWKSFLENDQRAFTGLYHLHFSKLFAYGMNFCNDREEVKEYIQQMFIKLWGQRHNLLQVRNTEHYLLASLRNIILSRRSFKTKFVFEELEEESYEFQINLPAEHFLINEERQKIIYPYFRKAVEKLTSRQKEIIYFRFHKDLSFEELSGIMNISKKGAYKLLARALETLKENLENLPMNNFYYLFIPFLPSTLF